MMNNTKLIIDRVVIHSGIKSVYDETFHSGLNVIRGDNGTGKSTIMELISYGLGGDIKKNSWKREALDCTSITIALKINRKPYVFKRLIEKETSKPFIQIFEGKYESALQSPEGWTTYKNKKSDIRKSYSMQIFSLLGLEQHVTEENDSLTIHQMLRLLYIDQDTPASKIFRTEPFIYDTESMRKAIGEYFFGFDNLEAHSIRQELYRAEKNFKKIDDELKTIYAVLGQTNIKVSIEEIENNIQSLNRDLQEISNKRIKLRETTSNTSTTEVNKEIFRIQKQIDKQAGIINETESDYIAVNYEISESIDFLKALEIRATSLKVSKTTYNCLHDIDFRYCPSCHSEIIKDKHNNSCSLCKSENTSSTLEDTYIESLNQIDFQISESQEILKTQKDLKSSLSAKIKKEKELLNRLKIDLNKISTTSSDYEALITKLAAEEGFILSQIENHRDKIDLAEKLDLKRKEKNRLQEEITKKQDKLNILEARREQRVRFVRNNISEKVVSILKRDGGVEKDFDKAQRFDFDFASDSLRLDDRANFSASSNVVLKNTFHLASLFTAINDDGFRLPCFSMFDNIEDKGMREERSQNFQKIIVELCNDIKDDFQIIMTTSMVDKTLNNDQYGVGQYYQKGTHTLNFQS
ncbi:AAA family ATPase [Ferrimonas aestuarii]|uniref:Rad50/SbcC-type AAA domain-containing protein n=1 Tax=Ferrimonas aestuarii TaxID=2569539 RepID=A0A4U1BPH0_9GAMM|nr:AAA family ATPase [Ferrimonas aestuarii]TKB52018.1 hypothetical protein FCL42_16505 [Ferrimonas aestuarii]